MGRFSMSQAKAAPIVSGGIMVLWFIVTYIVPPVLSFLGLDFQTRKLREFAGTCQTVKEGLDDLDYSRVIPSIDTLQQIRRELDDKKLKPRIRIAIDSVMSMTDAFSEHVKRYERAKINGDYSLGQAEKADRCMKTWKWVIEEFLEAYENKDEKRATPPIDQNPGRSNSQKLFPSP